ncbi:MAG: hypothetical protein ACPGVO_04330 [Spirulinaceae cyanobacterium]
MTSLIQRLVSQALDAHYLSIEAEDSLRRGLHNGSCAREDLHAFMRLQRAAMEGNVKQQSRLCCPLPMQSIPVAIAL